jgi:hypothetical protein
VNLYDIPAGKFVGHLLIPTTEKCVVHCLGRVSCFVRTQDLVIFYFICLIEKSKLSITFYSSIPRNIKNKLVFTLIRNRTFIFHTDIFPGSFAFFPLLGTFVVYGYLGVDKAYRVLVARNIHHSKQKHTFSVAGDYVSLAYNYELGIHLTYNRESRRHLFCLEIGCFVHKSFDLSIEKPAVRKLHIEMPRLMADAIKEFVMDKVAIDNQRTILQIHRNKDQHGNRQYSGVNAYSQI